MENVTPTVHPGLDQAAARRRDYRAVQEADVDGVSVEQAASFLGLSPVRVRELIRGGVLKAERVATSYRWAITTDSLAALAMQRSTGRGLRRLLARRRDRRQSDSGNTPQGGTS